jgi:hypothetical protein
MPLNGLLRPPALLVPLLPFPPLPDPLTPPLRIGNENRGSMIAGSGALLIVAGGESAGGPARHIGGTASASFPFSEALMLLVVLPRR